MKNLSRIISFFVVLMMASAAYAEDPPIAPSLKRLSATSASPNVLPMLIKGADKKVVKKFQMVLFSGESGSRAIFKVKPKFEGVDLGLTLSF